MTPHTLPPSPMETIDEQLILACINGNPLTVKQLLQQGANPNAKSRWGQTLFMIAARNDHINILQLLIQHGADPNITDQHGKTALHNALETKRRDTAQYLITQLQVDPNIQDRWGQTPFLLATQNNDIHMLQLLSQHGADPYIRDTLEKSALHYAVENKRRDIAQYLLIQLQLDPNTQDTYGITPFMIAAQKGDISMLRLLIQFGANPYAIDHRGRNALYYAAGCGNPKAVSFLITDFHLNPNSQDDQGNTPLHIAFQNGCSYIARTLIPLGANPHTPNHQGETVAAAFAHRRRIPKPRPSTITL